MSRMTKAATGAIAISLVAIITAIAWSSKPNAEQRAATVIHKVNESPDITINFTNFDGVPLTIKQATSKEVSGIDYQQTFSMSSADWRPDKLSAVGDQKQSNMPAQISRFRLTKIMVAGGRESERFGS